MTMTRPISNLPDEAQAWRRAIEQDIDAALRNARLASSSAKAGRSAAAGAARGLVAAGLSAAEANAAIANAARVPAAPADSAASSSTYFDEFGRPRATVYASCAPVSLDTRGRAIDVEYYELFGRPDLEGEAWRKLSETFLTPPEMSFNPLPAGDNWAFKMRGVSSFKTPGEFGAVIPLLLAKDVTPPPKPAAPEPSSRLGQITLGWSGKTADGNPQPPDFSHADVYMATTSTGAGTVVGRMNGNDGDTFVAAEQPYGQERWFWLVAVDYAGNRSTPSDKQSATAQSVVEDDIDNAIIDAITESVSSNIGGTATWSTAAPTAADGEGKASGAMWWRRDGNNDVIGVWEWTGVEWSPRALSNEVIASLDAGKINAGFIDVARLQANTITASKLLVSNFQNLVEDPGMVRPIGAAWTDGNGQASIYSDPDVDRLLRILGVAGTGITVRNSNFFTVKPGETYLVTARTYNGATAGSAGYGIMWYDANNTYISATLISVPAGGGWRDLSGRVDAPAKAVTGAYCLSTSAAFAGGNVHLSKPGVFRAVDSELIVDGAITARSIATDAVTAAKIEAGAVTAVKVAANAISADKIQSNAVTTDKINANAVTATEIAAAAITSKHTITGALVRTAASGARTEMNSSGLQVINSSGNPLVRLGYGIPTGLQVAQPDTGSLVALAPFVFGMQNATSNTPFNLTWPGSDNVWGATTLVTPGVTVTSPTGKFMVILTVKAAENSRQNYAVAMGMEFMVGTGIAGTVGNAFAQGEYPSPHFGIVQLTPNANYTVRLGFTPKRFFGGTAPATVAGYSVAIWPV
jgi:hypothetical protein